MQKLLTEFVGTLLFLFAIELAVARAGDMVPLIVGCALMVVVYMGGHTSGAHYNPAVSLAVLLRGKMTGSEFGQYVVAQVLGAIVGCFLAASAAGQSFAPAPGEGVGKGAALLVEFVFTFALCLVVLNVATAKATSGNSFYGLAIGFTIVVAVFAGARISGGAYNPAVAIGSTVVHAMRGGGSFSNLWLYVVGPLAGGVVAAAVFQAQGLKD